MEILFEGAREVRFVDVDEDFIEGLRVAFFNNVETGPASGELILRVSGRELLRRPFRVRIDRPIQVLTLVVSRDCRGIECPGTGSATATACLGGTCADPECSEETPEACPEDARCRDASDCEERDACSRALCRGVCVYLDRGECGPTSYCDPEVGCVARPIVDPPDSGADAETDSGADADIDSGADTDSGADSGCEEESTRPCYDGPEVTLGVGECQAGAQTCVAGRFGECVGQTVPGVDACGDDLDQDCNGMPDDGPGCCISGSTEDCYDADPASRGIGSCRDGARTCSRGVFGACVGQITPVAEDCGLPGDEDCDGRTDESCCPYGDVDVCCVNVADGESETRCNDTLADSIATCRSAGWRWTGPASCSIGGSPSCGPCFGAQGCCEE